MIYIYIYVIFYIVDAFVAMGGNADKSGSVQAEMLVNVIKVEFEMTIDIEVPISWLHIFLEII